MFRPIPFERFFFNLKRVLIFSVILSGESKKKEKREKTVKRIKKITRKIEKEERKQKAKLKSNDF